jgi:hypothetical protein
MKEIKKIDLYQIILKLGLEILVMIKNLCFKGYRISKDKPDNEKEEESEEEDAEKDEEQEEE